MVRPLRTIWALALCAGLALASPVSATSAVLMPRVELVKKSDLVVHATIGDKESRWNEERTHIVSRTEIHVTSFLKGSGEKALLVEQLGGTVGDKTMVVSGDARLEKGQEVVLFLRQGEGVVFLTALSQAAYEVKEGKVRRDMSGISLFRSVQGKLVPVHRLVEPKETFAQLKADVSRLARTP